MKNRSAVVLIFMISFFIPCVICMYQTMGPDGDRWRSLSKKVLSDSVLVPQVRGNIFSCDGKLLASSIPVYVLHMDFQADGLKRDTFLAKVDSLAMALSEFYDRDKTPAEYKRHLMEGFRKTTGNRNYCINRKPLSYVKWKQVKTFPIFRDVKCYTGQKRVQRKRPYDDMASRTIGGLYAEVEKGGMSGIEQYCDTFLKGRPGLASKVRVAGAYRNIEDVDAENGCDVVMTLDANIQDIVDSDLRRRLAMSEAEFGCATVMEVATGEIKAMSNLRRTSSGDYIEGANYSVNGYYMGEPGSTFKIATAVVALEAGIVDTSTIIDTGNGTCNFYGRNMSDSHPNGVLSFNRAIQQSSNIAMAKVIDGAFHKNPEKYIEALYDLGLVMPLGLEIKGAKPAKIKHPSETGKNGWSNTSLPWIAHGYETEMPPIQTLSFYNALANDATFVRPHLIREIKRNGEVIRSYGTDVLKSSICSKGTLNKVKQMMVDVVEYGTATAAKSKYFKIAGKTGTAIQKYPDGTRKRQLTFCGFFPADRPKYSIIVMAWYPHKGAIGAGSLCGATFKDIAEHIYAQSPLMHMAPSMEREDGQIFAPVTKDGSRKALEYLLKELSVNYRKSEEDAKGDWVRTHADERGVVGTVVGEVKNDRVPNVMGMGLKDAIFLLENRGMKVTVEGTGSVVKQSQEIGTFITSANKNIHLVLR